MACLVLSFVLPLSALAREKEYQVTGKVLEVSDTRIVVEKGDDKWEIDRTADTKVEGELKVGAKVTISYHMVADKVEGGEKKGK
jgi:hypothetical protein